MRLDDPGYLAGLDRHGLLARLDAWAEQLTAAASAAPAFSRPVAQVLLAGRGDSALAAAFTAAAAADCAAPLIPWTGSALPAWASPATGVLVFSHSGNTAAMTVLAEAAAARGLPVLAVTSGGRLADQPGVTAWRYAAEAQPHPLPAQTALALAALARAGLIPDPAGALAEAAQALRSQSEFLRAASPIHRNPAKRLAGQLINRYPALFVVDELAPAGRWWQGQINQLAKAWAQSLPLAEAEHAVAGRFLPEPLIDKFMALFLRGPAPHAPAEEVRLAFMTAGFNTDEVAASGPARLAHLLTLAQYGSYTAAYLAAGYGVDPGAAFL